MLATFARSLLALVAAAGPKTAPAATVPTARPLTLADVQGLKLETLQELTSFTRIASSRMSRSSIAGSRSIPCRANIRSSGFGAGAVA